MVVTRRKMLSAVSVALTGAIAGCLGGDDDDGPADVDFDQDSDDVDPDQISVPTVLFSLSYEEEEGIVQVRHSGGRSVSVDNLFIRGEGISDEHDEVAFIDLPGSDLSAGEMFGSGDRVHVEPENDDFRVEVVWVDEETNYPKTIEQMAVGLDEV